jgi:ppGpp synthetase/RelA/SpoT-type nucleotidyltranferase
MENLDREYENTISRIQEFRLVLERLIQVLLEAGGIRVHSVTSRVKSKNSVMRKLERPGKERDINSLTDLLGVRIITYFRDEVDAVAKLIEREFLIDPENSIDKRNVLDPDRFGYLSLHHIAQLNQTRSALAEYRSYKDIRFELQIRSILQHAWAEIEHDLGYKTEAAVPRTVRRRFSRLAGLLELADDEFLGIRGELAPSTSAQRSRTAANLQADIERLLANPGLIRLPAWPKGWSESDYNTYVSRSDPRFLLLDRLLIEIPSTHSGFEPCDLFGPNDELIHIKRMRLRNSASFGHLFNQALVTTEILLDFTDARKTFVDAVNGRGADRELRRDFRPRVVVLAFPSKEGPVVPVQSIPVLARVTLSRVAETLEGRGVTLRIVGIDEQLCGWAFEPPKPDA